MFRFQVNLLSRIFTLSPLFVSFDHRMRFYKRDMVFVSLFTNTPAKLVSLGASSVCSKGSVTFPTRFLTFPNPVFYPCGE